MISAVNIEDIIDDNSGDDDDDNKDRVCQSIESFPAIFNTWSSGFLLWRQ